MCEGWSDLRPWLGHVQDVWKRGASAKEWKGSLEEGKDMETDFSPGDSWRKPAFFNTLYLAQQDPMVDFWPTELYNNTCIVLKHLICGNLLQQQ